MSLLHKCNAENKVETNWGWLLHEFGLCPPNLSLAESNPLVSLHIFLKDQAILLPVGHLIHLTRHVFTLPHANGSDYLKQKCPELFQETIYFLIPFLESIQFDPTFGELGVCAKLSSAWGPWCFNLSNTAAETTLLCVFMDKRHCNCISSRPANELFNHLHMDVL